MSGVRRRVQVDFSDTVSLTKQSFKEPCDMNNILKGYKKTGIITHIRNAVPSYLDVSSYSDYQSSVNLVMRAQESFDSLPSLLRAKFNNDPQEFVAFVSDASNRDEAIRLGLVQEPSESVVSGHSGGDNNVKTSSKSSGEPLRAQKEDNKES